MILYLGGAEIHFYLLQEFVLLVFCNAIFGLELLYGLAIVHYLRFKHSHHLREHEILS